MPIPGPGTPLTIGMIADEFGGTPADNLSEYYRGGGLVPDTIANAGIPTSGIIRIGNFYGSSSRNIVNVTITGNTQNYDVFANRGPTYVAGVTDLTLTVNPGVVVGSASTSSFAMLVPSAFSPTDTVRIVNNGTIIGMGGTGGRGSNGAIGTSSPGFPGNVGGNALSISRPTTITNNGTVAGAGGGGGGGAPGFGPSSFSAGSGGGGGGGGAGSSGGTAGVGGAGSTAGNPGGTGTLTTGGGGGAGGPGPAPGGTGGTGGGQGAVGTSGSPTSRNVGGTGGGAGNYIVGNPFATWPVTGTRLGGVA